MHFLILALDGGEWSASHPSHFTPRGRAPGTHWRGDKQLKMHCTNDVPERHTSSVQLSARVKFNQLNSLSCASNLCKGNRQRRVLHVFT